MRGFYSFNGTIAELRELLIPAYERAEERKALDGLLSSLFRVEL